MSTLGFGVHFVYTVHCDWYQGEGGHVTDPGSAHSVGKTPRRPPGGQVTDGDRIKTLATVGGVSGKLLKV